MAIFSHKDLRIIVGGNEICCDNISINTNLPAAPTFTIESKAGSIPKNNNHREGAVKFSYYITGADPIYNHLTQTPESFISVEAAGLKIISGYLTDYAINVNQFGYTKGEASLKYYEEVGGTFTTQSSAVIPSQAEIIKTTNAEISGSHSFSVDDLETISYRYTCEMTPVFDVEGLALKEVRRGKKKVDSQALSIGADISLPHSGLRESFKINLKDKNDAIVQSFTIDGLLYKKSTVFTTSDIVKSNYEIGSARLGALNNERPTITSFSPAQGAPDTVATSASHSSVTVNGNNFLNVDQVMIGEFPCKITSSSESSVVFEVSNDILSGYSAPIRLITETSDPVSSATVFTVTGGLTDMHGF
tara:strand:+ start:30598 stop:31680 length:1083 start_codon:yes stop_codon:yes gene_type:complete